jgi:hypothetical protein
MNIDEIARVATRDLHQAAEPVRTIDMSAHRRLHVGPGMRWAGGAVAVAAIIAVVAVVAQRDGGDPVATAPSDVPRYILGTVPAGLHATGGSDLPISGGSGVELTFATTVYGDDAAAAWLRGNSGAARAGQMLVVSVGTSIGTSGTGSDANQPPSDGEPVSIDGHPFATLQNLGRPFLAARFNGQNVMITSPGADRAGLVALAASIRITDGQVGVDAAGELKPLATSALSPSMVSVLGSGTAGANGHVVGYQADTEVQPVPPGGVSLLVLSALAASQDDLDVMRATADNATPLTVRGKPGWALEQRVSDDGSVLRSLVWFERPGVLVVLTGNADLAVLIAAADTIVEANDVTWKWLSQPLGLPAQDATVVASGELDGHAWRLTYSASQGSMCFDVQESGRNHDGSCSGPAAIGLSGGVPVGNGSVKYQVIPAPEASGRMLTCDGKGSADTKFIGDVVPNAAVMVDTFPGCSEGNSVLQTVSTAPGYPADTVLPGTDPNLRPVATDPPIRVPDSTVVGTFPPSPVTSVAVVSTLG